jgi:hypothetical protein
VPVVQGLAGYRSTALGPGPGGGHDTPPRPVPAATASVARAGWGGSGQGVAAQRIPYPLARARGCGWLCCSGPEQVGDAVDVVGLEPPEAVRVPINHPSRSSRMLVLPEDTTESIMSTDVESRDLGSVGTRNGKRTERGCLSKGPVRSVFVVEDLELAQGMQ